MSKKEIVFIAGIILLALFFLSPMLQSIVSISQVTYDKTGAKWVANVVVNSNDTLTFSKSTLIADLGNGQEIKSQSDITVNVIPLNPQCNYALTAIKYYPQAYTIQFPITYYSLGNPKLSVPYTAKVTKTTALGSTQLNPDGSTNFFGYVIPKTVDATSGETTLTFTDSSSGAKVFIQNLGALRGAYDCPSVGNVILVPNYASDLKTITGYKLVNEIDWKNRVNETFASPSFLYNNSVSSPTQFSGYKADVSKANLNVELSSKDWRGNITISIDAKFADAVTYTPSQGKPVILSYTSSKGSSLNQNDATVFTTQVKNEGTTDVFEFFITSQNGLLSFNRATTSTTINEGQTKTVSFIGTGLVSGTDNICIKVTNTSINLLVDSKCLTQTVIKTSDIEPVSAPVCGDGVCSTSQGETFNSCPNDCQENTPTPVACSEGYHLVVKDEPVWWSLGLLKTTSTYCEQDFPIEFALIVFGAVTAILAFFYFRRK